MYDPRLILKQEPNVIREFVLAVLSTLVMAGVIDVSAEVVAGVGLLVSMGLGLFYVRPASVSRFALDQLPAKPARAAKKAP